MVCPPSTAVKGKEVVGRGRERPGDFHGEGASYPLKRVRQVLYAPAEPRAPFSAHGRFLREISAPSAALETDDFAEVTEPSLLHLALLTRRPDWSSGLCRPLGAKALPGRLNGSCVTSGGSTWTRDGKVGWAGKGREVQVGGRERFSLGDKSKGFYLEENRGKGRKGNGENKLPPKVTRPTVVMVSQAGEELWPLVQTRHT